VSESGTTVDYYFFSNGPEFDHIYIAVPGCNRTGSDVPEMGLSDFFSRRTRYKSQAEVLSVKNNYRERINIPAETVSFRIGYYWGARRHRLAHYVAR